MKENKLTTFIILLGAISIVTYVFFDKLNNDQVETMGLNLFLSQNYLTTEKNNTNDLDKKGILPGDLALDFTLPIWGENEKVSLSDHNGNFVVVNMWASWCPPCRDEMPYLIQFHEEYEGENVQVLGVNMTTQERNLEVVAQFIEDFQIPFPTLLDERGEVGFGYQVMAIPMTLIIAPDGRIVERHQGYVNYELLKNYYIKARENY
ncbi:thiol-disulfide isomerase/thioredoxin [Evansella vedderi]|uniref:Thiol-disulfide isomerase/thioredoxin n=1 Tax=Evansella vedderi TaxID=38282 RepID=A0ABU0A1D8_9BACI|nr:TlpA disulfide reductase family protein [Evansella vedderi]MDQ0256165.1 thiol-disulfide isomerase/thioredoxin [Evansella vedderi]